MEDVDICDSLLVTEVFTPAGNWSSYPKERLSMTKLKWGMIGGGEGSQIGPAHRLGAVADGRFELVAAAFDHRPAKGKAFAESLGIDTDRAYGTWAEMTDIAIASTLVSAANFLASEGFVPFDCSPSE